MQNSMYVFTQPFVNEQGVTLGQFLNGAIQSLPNQN